MTETSGHEHPAASSESGRPPFPAPLPLPREEGAARLLSLGASPTPGRAPAEPTLDELRSRFPELEILECVGRGGMGAVYRARQVRLQREVALKILPLGLAASPDFRERFAREAQTLARLQHPRIVALHEFGERDGLLFLVMEYVDGASLRALMATGRLSPAQTLEIVPQVCEALAYAHARGVVHRDIKPENILVDARGGVKIADFGLAKGLATEASGYRLTESGQRLGTPHYMAPETVHGAEGDAAADPRADIYALGVVFYEMLTGRLPLGRFAPPSSHAQVARGVDDVVMRSLEADPAQRYQRVEEVAREVSGLDASSSAPDGAGASPPAVSPPDVPPPVTSADPRWSLASKLALALPLVMVAFALLAVPLIHVLRARLATDGSRGSIAGVTIAVPLLMLPVLAACAAGWFGVRRARAGGRRGGLVVSVVVALSVPLGVLDWVLARPLETIADPDVRGVATLVAIPLILALDVWIAVRLHRWATVGRR